MPEFLDEKLESYARSGIYPFHMPGHKRNVCCMSNPYAIDMTEIEGFDDLHASGGVLKEAQQRAASLYGSERSYYLVNGSTCGILTALSAALPSGGTVLMARNSHKSAYHAVYLRNLEIVYVYPKKTEFGILGSVDPIEVEESLRCNPNIKAVFLTSPTYEGVVSDIASIARIAHKYQAPLIVDEAHGAHFGIHASFPSSSVRLGADLVVMSMHKTLPSLTQTALLHLNSSYVTADLVERFLNIYETSSPSYVLMAGMEKCIRFLRENGAEAFEEYAKRLNEFYREAEALSRLHVMRREAFSSEEAFGLDPSKIVISAKGTELTGKRLAELLRKAHRIQLEMSSGFYALGMTSVMDSKEGFARFSKALRQIDGETGRIRKTADCVISFSDSGRQRMKLSYAMDQPRRAVSFEDSIGRVSGGMVCLYPPGIPILLPGEEIDGAFVENIRNFKKMGLNLQGIADMIHERIYVVT